MTYNILCKQVELADSSKEKILAKVKKLDRFFGDENECKISVSEQKEHMVVEIMFDYKGFLIRSEARNRDLTTAVDMCMSNIDRQIRKNKTKLARRLRDDALENYSVVSPGAEDIQEDKEEFKIIKVKRVSTKPMMTEEAVLQMNMLGHDFFVFTDAETGGTNIVYRRKDGNYSLIETEE